MIRRLLLWWWARRSVPSEFTFPKALRDARRVLILMPSQNEALRQSEVFLSRVRQVFPRAEVTLLYPPKTMVARFYNPYRFKIATPEKGDVWWFGIPRKSFVRRVLPQPFDVLITLNRAENVFFAAVTMLSQTPVRIGLPNGMGDPFINVELRHGRDTTDIKTEFILFIDMIRRLATTQAAAQPDTSKPSQPGAPPATRTTSTT